MIKTLYGVFDGNTWEDLCQKCFKIKYENDGYQEMEASPGDFGIEGFTRSGLAFQCYCPDQEYTQNELYENIRDKITTDLKKLKTYEMQLKARLSNTKIKIWQFITPLSVKNDILKHLTVKKAEVKTWGLQIIDDEFDIQIKDIDFLGIEINKVLTIKNQKLSFQIEIPEDVGIDWTNKEIFHTNINRKNSIRIGASAKGKITELNSITLEQLVNGDSKLKRIMSSMPDLYYKLAVLFNSYENSVKEKCLTWSGTAENLINHLKNDLEELIKEDFISVSCSDRRSLIDYLVSKWIALCPLDFVEVE